jgi:hypothetical protein
MSDIQYTIRKNKVAVGVFDFGAGTMVSVIIFKPNTFINIYIGYNSLRNSFQSR